MMYRKDDPLKIKIEVYSYSTQSIVETKEASANVMFIERHGDLYRMTLKWRTRKHTIPVRGFYHTKVFEFKEGCVPTCNYYIGHHSVHHGDPKFKIHVSVCKKIDYDEALDLLLK